jgi:hypothetical protein
MPTSNHVMSRKVAKVFKPESEHGQEVSIGVQNGFLTIYIFISALSVLIIVGLGPVFEKIPTLTFGMLKKVRTDFYSHAECRGT